MRDGVLWTNLTRSEIATAMAHEGFEVSTATVDRLLEDSGFRHRKAERIKTMGESADRDTQFKKIAQLRTRYLKAGLPVVSIDAKKREILGDYVRPGHVLSTAPLRGWDHDFPQKRLGVVIPHGLYDVGRNEGYVHLGTSHDTVSALQHHRSWRAARCYRAARAARRRRAVASCLRSALSRRSSTRYTRTASGCRCFQMSGNNL